MNLKKIIKPMIVYIHTQNHMPPIVLNIVIFDYNK